MRSGRLGGNPKKSYGTTQSIQNVTPGNTYSDKNGDWLCIVASGAIPQYAAAAYDPTSATKTAAALTTTTAGSNTLTVGFAQAALADGETGLLWIGGAGGGGIGSGIKGKVAASYVAKAILYTTASPAGTVDDSATTKIQNVIGMTTDSGSGSSIELYSTGPIYVN